VFFPPKNMYKYAKSVIWLLCYYVESVYNIGGRRDKMNYSDYKKARNLAWEVLIQEEVTALPVMIG